MVVPRVGCASGDDRSDGERQSDGNALQHATALSK
jgi:hypothetical protein